MIDGVMCTIKKEERGDHIWYWVVYLGELELEADFIGNSSSSDWARWPKLLRNTKTRARRHAEKTISELRKVLLLT